MPDTYSKRCLIAAGSPCFCCRVGAEMGQVTHGDVDVYYVDGATQAEAERSAPMNKTWALAAAAGQLRRRRKLPVRMIARRSIRQADERMALKEPGFTRRLDGAAVRCTAATRVEHAQNPAARRLRYGVVEGKWSSFRAT